MTSTTWPRSRPPSPAVMTTMSPGASPSFAPARNVKPRPSRDSALASLDVAVIGAPLAAHGPGRPSRRGATDIMADAVPARRRSRAPGPAPAGPPAHPAGGRPATGSMTGVPWHPAARLEPSRVSTPRPAAVIVLAAGEGTRMKSATPKVLHPIGGVTLVGHAIRAARATGAEHVGVVVRHERDRVVAVCTSLDADLVIADQDEVKGTGRAVECGLLALPADLSGTVLVTYGDVPLLTGDTLVELARAHAESGSAVSVVTAHLADPTGYGRVVRGADGRVEKIVEHKDATDARARDHRDQLGHLRLRGRRAARRARPGRHRQRAGREVPHRRHRHRPRRRPPGARPRARRPLADRGRQRPRAARGPRARAQPPGLRAAHARRRHDRRPGHDVDRRRRQHRPGHHGAARHPAARRDDHRRGCRRSAPR